MIDVALRRRVADFTLDVAFRNEGGITALFGPSGSGKSMTISLIAGLTRPDGGHVRIGRTTLVDTGAGIAVPPHRRRVGLVFQDAHLFPHMNVRRNLLYGQGFAPPAARTVRFDAVVDTLGIGHLLARRPAGLSGGERQRVAIGRALLSCPRLLLFDEPLAALDRQRKLDILPLIERLRDDFAIPIVYVSHAMEEVVRLATHVVVLEGGRVRAAGDPASVLSAMPHAAGGDAGQRSVLDVTVGAVDPAYGLTALHHPAGTLWLTGVVEPAGAAARVLIDATDVTLAVGRPGTLSVRGVLAGRVAAIAASGAVASIEVVLEGHGTLVAQITRKAADDLALKAGTAVSALIKTVALDAAVVVPLPVRSAR